MICPELRDYVKAEMEKEASRAKNLRKAQEERDSARRKKCLCGEQRRPQVNDRPFLAVIKSLGPLGLGTTFKPLLVPLVPSSGKTSATRAYLSVKAGAPAFSGLNPLNP